MGQTSTFQFSNKAIAVSLLLSASVLIAVVIINIQIAHVYDRSDGKTKALFGIIELVRFGYKYYLALPALCALVIALITFRKSKDKKWAIAAVLLAVMATAFIFIRFWTILTKAYS